MPAHVTLEAHDVWFFRTSRPFGALQVASSGGESELLPPPSAVFGALRARLGETVDSMSWAQYRDDWAHAAEHKRWPEAREEALRRHYERLGPPTSGGDGGGEPWPEASVRLLGCLPVELTLGGDDRARDEDVLFPLPGFVLAAKGTGGRPDPLRDLRLALPRAVSGGVIGAASGTLPLWPVLPPAGEPDFIGESRRLYVRRLEWRRLLAGLGPERFRQSEESRPLPADEMAEVEPRVGIARDIDRRTVKEGHLYTLDTHRWRGRVGFGRAKVYGLRALTEGVSAADFPHQPLVFPLGGEGRLAWGRVEDHPGGWLGDEEAGEALEAIAAQGGWWLALASPAAFEEGWRPCWLKPDGADCWRALLRDAAGAEVDCGRLVGLVAETPYPQSGWDLAGGSKGRVRGRPKPLRRLMPVGATWFFTLPEGPRPAGTVLAAIGKLQGTCVADRDAHAGYGLAFAGAWKPRVGGR